MQPSPDQAQKVSDRVVITLRAHAETPPSRPKPFWTVFDAAVAAAGLIVAGWLLVPIVIILRAIGRYHRIAATQPALGDHRIGWLGRTPTRGVPLQFPRRLLPLLVFDLAIGSVSLRPAGRSGWISTVPTHRAGTRSTMVHLPDVIDLTEGGPASRSERSKVDACGEGLRFDARGDTGMDTGMEYPEVGTYGGLMASRRRL